MPSGSLGATLVNYAPAASAIAVAGAVLIALIKVWPLFLRTFWQRIEKLELDRELCEAETRLLRHRLSNETQSLDSLLLLLEAAPTKVAASVKTIREQRALKAQEFAIERAAILTRFGRTEEVEDFAAAS